MILADQIREYVLQNEINPARAKGLKTVSFGSGDIHEGMGLVDRMPAVCGAIDAEKFLGYASVRLISRSGPPQSSTVRWVFEL
jgi:5-methylcytosine-specific restriction enzyme B